MFGIVKPVLYDAHVRAARNSDRSPRSHICSNQSPSRAACLTLPDPLHSKRIDLKSWEGARGVTRMCARLEIRTCRLAAVRARAVRAKCSLAGLTSAWRVQCWVATHLSPLSTRFPLPGYLRLC